MAYIQDLLEKSYAEFFMDNVALVLLNKPTYSLFFCHLYTDVLKLLWREHFLKIIYRLVLFIFFLKNEELLYLFLFQSLKC